MKTPTPELRLQLLQTLFVWTDCTAVREGTAVGKPLVCMFQSAPEHFAARSLYEATTERSNVSSFPKAYFLPHLNGR